MISNQLNPFRPSSRLGLRTSLGILAIAAISAGGPAAAQQGPAFSPSDSLSRAPTDTRYPGENYRKFDAARTAKPELTGPALYQSAVDFAKCIGRKHSDKLADLLGKPLSTDGETQAAQEMARSARNCSEHRLEVSMRLLRGATAEALLAGMKMPLGLTDADFTAFRAVLPTSGDPSAVSVQKIIECEVSTAPGMVRNVVDAAPGSHEADAAAKQLAAATATCGSVAAGDPETSLVYRSYLAEGLYHLLASAAKDSKSSKS